MTRIALLFAAAFMALSALPAVAQEVQGDRLVMRGIVDTGMVDRGLRELAANPGIRVVRFENSPGGAAHSMILFANTIRERRLDTEVRGPCASACAMMFMGGVRRRVADGARPDVTFVAFHGVSRAGAFDDTWNQTTANALRRFSGGRMPAALASEMMALPSNGLAIFWHPRLHRRQDGSSVAWCAGGEANMPRGCPGRSNTDAVRAGIFTQ
jgi:hypothetical protein